MKADLRNTLVVNFKTYAEATGRKALELAKVCDEVAKETGANIVVAVQASDIGKISETVDIKVFAQHIDAVKYGSSTGWILPEAVVEAGAVGTLISHSERKLMLDKIKPRIDRANEVGLTTIVCSGKETNDETIEESMAIAQLRPDYIAAEPPEMIGGDISVTTRPELILAFVDAVKKANPKVGVLTGAGVKTGLDVADAIKLGT
ncbi:MAG: triose-phosphate isomerase, partial [Candidatus Altiarchaeota archaeon]|nr:triose-phosphate isomerase [Candidatus Altiarchaeota archaeon]